MPRFFQHTWPLPPDRYMYKVPHDNADLLQPFKDANPDIAAEHDDDEIMKRYIHRIPDCTLTHIQNNMHWIPEYDEIILAGRQEELLDRIWDGRQKHVVDNTEFASDDIFCEYTYWIDFENKIIEAEGVVEDTLVVPFKDLEAKLFSKKNREYGEAEKARIKAKNREYEEIAEAQRKARERGRQLETEEMEAKMAGLDVQNNSKKKKKADETEKPKELEGSSDDEGSVDTIKGIQEEEKDT
jgi:hypothetical protein